MEERERWLSDQPLEVLRAHAQECGINTAGCIEKHDLVQRILRCEPREFSSGSFGVGGRPDGQVEAGDSMVDVSAEATRPLRAGAVAAPPAAASQPQQSAEERQRLEQQMQDDESLARRLQEEEEEATHAQMPPMVGFRDPLRAAVEGRHLRPSGLGLSNATRRGLAASRQRGGHGEVPDPIFHLLRSLSADAGSSEAAGIGRRGGAGHRHMEGEPQLVNADAASAQALARLLAQVVLAGGGADDSSGGSGSATMLAELLARMAPNQGIDESMVAQRTGTMTFREPTQPSGAAEGRGSSDDERKCMVCLETFSAGEDLRILPCLHRYHLACIDPWLAVNRHCPVCKHDVTQ